MKRFLGFALGLLAVVGFVVALIYIPARWYTKLAIGGGTAVVLCVAAALVLAYKQGHRAGAGAAASDEAIELARLKLLIIYETLVATLMPVLADVARPSQPGQSVDAAITQTVLQPVRAATEKHTGRPIDAVLWRETPGDPTTLSVAAGALNGAVAFATWRLPRTGEVGQLLSGALEEAGCSDLADRVLRPAPDDLHALRNLGYGSFRAFPVRNRSAPVAVLMLTCKEANGIGGREDQLAYRVAAYLGAVEVLR